eukprot:TRINITY_DN10183_c0_g1_i1.p1 TRINITY_DN10183_c0_g1~~TRINITY_DN10183_c0_g1_i1.p1  ORF type:complete len:257 (+),score=43.86 TRINITY_DN10183_c0_g1_i1:144-914(+)
MDEECGQQCDDASEAAAVVASPPQDEDCGICFESISEVGGAVELPCSCRLPYCFRCWDRTLAASMIATGQPRCPSCRSLLCVDYDVEKGALIFSKDPRAADVDPEVRRRNDVFFSTNETRVRLSKQTKPRQLMLLRRHGAELAAGGSPGIPRCVCGGGFKQLGLRERVHLLVEPKGEHGHLMYLGRRFSVPQLIEMGAITCDVCDLAVKEGNEVFMCENGALTILHAHSYDICQQCFQKHVQAGEASGDMEDVVKL